MSNSPLLTICIPTYSRAGFLRECLGALLDQGLAREEFVVAISDNGSTDETPEVVRSFESRLSIDYHRSDETIPMVDNLNRAIDFARSDYLAILCDDDLVAPGQFGRALRCLRAHPDACLYAALGLAQYRFGDPSAFALGDLIGAEEVEPFLFRFGPLAWLANCSVHTPMTVIGSVFRRDRITRKPIFDADYPQESDRLLFLDMAGKGEIYASPWIGGHLRYHAAQQTNRNEDHRDEASRVTERVLERARSEGLDLPAFWASYLPTAAPKERAIRAKSIAKAYPEALAARILEQAGEAALWKQIDGKRKRKRMLKRLGIR